MSVEATFHNQSQIIYDRINVIKEDVAREVEAKAQQLHGAIYINAELTILLQKSYKDFETRVLQEYKGSDFNTDIAKLFITSMASKKFFFSSLKNRVYQILIENCTSL